jgi:hypothetical protein
MANLEANIAPSPDVQYLPTVFRRVQSGDIRMPAFQRGFVWDRKQVLELLSSIYQGFPIGSLLLWKTELREMNLEDPSKSFFPRIDEKYPTNYILDGLQRLSSLYAVFHYNAADHPKKFEVAFDLERQVFIYPQADKPTVLPLSVLFKPTEFIQYHGRLSLLPNGNILINNAVSLLTTFQEYQLPIVTIEGRRASEVVQIFERINSTGTRLGSVDFMRAVTWSGAFDLNRKLDEIGSAARAEGFHIPHETLVKVLAIVLGYPPMSDAMLAMRTLTVAQLESGVADAISTIARTIDFLRSNMRVTAYALVPYQAQFLALIGFNKLPTKPSPSTVSQVCKWYWTASLNEQMQGRTDDQVARLVEQMEHLRVGKIKRLKGKLTLSANSLRDRRFRWKGALSSALASMLAKNSCRSLVSGSPIDPTSYLSSNSGKNFIPFADERALAAATGRSTGRVVANAVVAADADLPTFREKSASQIIRDLQKNFPNDWVSILGSQFIPEAAAQALTKGRPLDFLEARAQGILSYAKTLAFPPSAG